MSSIGFLLAPLREIPTERDDYWMSTVQSWLHIADFAWLHLWEQLPKEEQRKVPRMIPGTGLSSNAMDAQRRKDPELIASAEAWTRRAWDEWNGSGRNAPLPVANAAAAHEALKLDSRMSLPELVGYSGGFKPIPPKKLKRGGVCAFLKNDGDPNSQAFGEDYSVQRALFLEIVRGHGGDHLAVWTFGHALNVLVARSASPGTRPVLHGPFSVRASAASGAKRPGGFMERLEDALRGSSLHPDLAALRQELAKSALSVEACFAALGLPGARDFSSPDTSALWEEMNDVAVALLGGQAADKQKLKHIKEVLEPLGDSARLPAKGKIGKGETARAVAETILSLHGALGEPKDSNWARRFRAVGWYWDITDGDAVARLTFANGEDKAGVGTASSLARLLTHFPKNLLRDPVFLATLALECEAANGHAYVEGLSKLAEQTDKAELVLVAVPSEQRSKLRETLGISSEETENPAGIWSGEALISGTSITKGDLADAARRFMTKNKASGVIAELSSEGATNVAWYKVGEPAGSAKDVGLDQADRAALSEAAKGLFAREGFIALGAGDVLAPGDWHEGSYSGASKPGVEDHRVKKRRHAQQLMSTQVEAGNISSMTALLPILGSRLRYNGPLKESDGGIVSLRITLPAEDASYLLDLRNDLQGRSMVDRYGEVWADGRDVCGYSCSTVDVGLLSQILGDAPSGTTLKIGVGTEVRGAWRIA
jgi:hypothetical protein